jgi:hypothetical protein
MHLPRSETVLERAACGQIACAAPAGTLKFVLAAARQPGRTRIMKTKSLAWGLVLCILLASCASRPDDVVTGDRTEARYEIDSVTFIFEDIHPSFWGSASRRDSLFLSVFIYFDGEKPLRDEIQEIRIYDESNRYWTMSLDKYAKESKDYIGGYTRFRTDEYSLNWSVMSLNEYRIQMRLLEGNISTYRYDPADPNLNNANAKSYLYSTDYAGRKDDRYVRNLSRAVIREAYVQDEVMELTFTVDDPRTQTGEVAFYTKDTKYLGETEEFKNIYSLEVRKLLNEGSAFHIDGRENRVRISPQDIEFSAEGSFPDISYVMVSLAFNDPERLTGQDQTIFRSKSEMTLLERR